MPRWRSRLARRSHNSVVSDPEVTSSILVRGIPLWVTIRRDILRVLANMLAAAPRRAWCWGVRAVKEIDLISIGLVPRRFESCPQRWLHPFRAPLARARWRCDPPRGRMPRWRSRPARRSHGSVVSDPDVTSSIRARGIPLRAKLATPECHHVLWTWRASNPRPPAHKTGALTD